MYKSLWHTRKKKNSKQMYIICKYIILGAEIVRALSQVNMCGKHWHFYVFTDCTDSNENKLIAIVLAFQSKLKLWTINMVKLKTANRTPIYFYWLFFSSAAYKSGSMLVTSFSRKMCCLLLRYPFILIKKIILLPLKFIALISSVAFMAYLFVILCAFLSKDGYDFISYTCTPN